MKTIVIADDEEHLRLLVSTTLAEADYRILEAEDGPRALELARKECPDLLILDWMMPRASGIDVLKALRQDPETDRIPVIMLTAKSQKADRNQAILQGIRGYLVKPFSPLELIELVEKVLHGASP
jgi:CheY-like chemotaxis protein